MKALQAVVVALGLASPALAECGWIFQENLDPSDCSWDTVTLSCPSGYVYTCLPGGDDSGSGNTGGGSDGGGSDTGGTGATGGGDGDGATSSLTLHQTDKLNGGRVIAEIKLNQSSCFNMWRDHGLSGDGLSALQITEYKNGGFSGPCRFRPGQPFASAYTSIGSTTVWLCDNFGFLPYADASRSLIHEALHTGGLQENPPIPSAMTSGQINNMVYNRCPC